MIKNYYYLTKPGIIYGNSLTVIAGFFLASQKNINFFLLFQTLAGISLIIASACVFNNYLDRDLDAKMKRTQKRALVTGVISNSKAIIFGISLGLVGVLTLLVFTNILSLATAVVGWLFYVCIYTPLKRKTKYSTLIGSIPGAVPILVGYLAVVNKLDVGALLVFIILVVWQMPHFYAIAIRREDEYMEASMPTLMSKQGITASKIHILIYISAYILATLSLTYFKLTGYVYFFVMLLIGLYWFYVALNSAQDQKLWAKKVFLVSLMVLTVFCVIIPIDILIKNII